MTPKEAMEKAWLESGVNNPLRPARWILYPYGLAPDHRSLVANEDDGRPLDPPEARYS
jgi:hypothetical protein